VSRFVFPLLLILSVFLRRDTDLLAAAVQFVLKHSEMFSQLLQQTALVHSHIHDGQDQLLISRDFFIGFFNPCTAGSDNAGSIVTRQRAPKAL
jgi:hypothetical protein